jgi:hypothetical protein
MGSDPGSFQSYLSADVATFVYDGCGRVTRAEGAVPIGPDHGAGHEPAHLQPIRTEPPRPAQAARPWRTHTFEFRLSGAETREQALPLEDGAACVGVAATAVHAYLTRAGDGATAASPIGGVEVRAELRDAQVVCTAGLSDFAVGDLVVVRVDVGIFRIW